MIAIVIDVSGRYLFNQPMQLIGTVIVVTTPMLFALGLGYAQVTNSHINVKLLSSKLGHLSRYIVDIAGLIINVLLLALISWLVTDNAITSLNAGEFEPGLVRVAIYPTKFVLAFNITLLCLRYLAVLLQHLIPKAYTEVK